MLPRELVTSRDFPTPTPEAWRALVDADLKGAPFERRLVTHTYEGIHIRPLYTWDDWPHAGEPSGFSGQMPMTRGGQALGRSQQGWEVRQERAEADPAALNAALLEDLEGGVNSVTIRLDAAARAGLDADEHEALLLAARDGSAIYGIGDLDRALGGVRLDLIRVALEAGSAFVPAAAMLAALWARRGIDARAASGAFNADPLAVLARDGSLPYPLGEGLARLARLADWTSQTYPGVTAVRVGTAPYHHAGATATQDLAFSMATALEYLRAMTGAGMSVDDASRQLVFSFAVGCRFYLAAAKLRAARRLFARVIEACGGSLEARRMVMHVRASKRVFTTRDPWVNILRNTACVLAAGIGGADCVGSVPMDAAIGEPSAMARRIARNTHHLLMDECHLHRVCDPGGGSWYLESLTDELASKAWIIFQEIERQGGMARALTSGWVHRQIDDALEPRVRNLASRRDGVLGVSEFPDIQGSAPPASPVDLPAVAAAAAQRTRAARATCGAADTAPDMDAVVELASSGATIGQLARSLRPAGRPQTLDSAIHVHPYAEPFEHLRDASDAYAATCGHRPGVFLVSLGSPTDHLARTNFARNLFEAGGFQVAGGEGFTDAGRAAEALKASGATIAVICGSDAQYPAMVPALGPALHAAGAHAVVLAGNPGAAEAAYRAAGVDRFVFVKCDVVSLLRDLLTLEGVCA